MANQAVSSSVEHPPAEETYQQIDRINQEAEGLIGQDIQRATLLCEQAIELSTSPQLAEPYRLGWARAMHTLGRLHSLQGKFGSALSWFMKALALFEETQSPADVALVYSYIGVTYCYISDYPHGFEYLFKALKQTEALGMEIREAEILNDIGYAYVTLNQFTEALPYLEKSLSILQKCDANNPLSWTLDSLCHAHSGLGNYDQALLYGMESVRISEELNEWKKVAEHRYSVGLVYAARGDREKAQECYRLSLQIARQHGFPHEAANALRKLGEMQCEDGDLDSAHESLQEALALATAIEARRLEYDCCLSLVNLFRTRGEFEKALEYFERYHEIWVDVFNAEADQRIKNLEVLHQLDTARKEAEIAHLKNLALVKEVEERKSAQIQLERLANTDALTGLFNRRCFFELAGRAFDDARREKIPLSVLMVDIDHFKRVNDTYGHLTGDQVLVGIAEVIRKSFRKDDIIARFGGEEFVIMLPGSDAAKARQASERLRKRVMQTPVRTDHGVLSLTVSIGIALATEEPELTFEMLLTRADRAMYRAKRAGRNRVRLYMVEGK